MKVVSQYSTIRIINYSSHLNKKQKQVCFSNLIQNIVGHDQLLSIIKTTVNYSQRIISKNHLNYRSYLSTV